MKLTIDEIAKLAKVSRSTVSRAINNQEGISKDTRDAIIAVMEKHNYRPNAFARAISSNKTKSIGIFMPSFLDLINVSSVYTDVILGITEVVTARGYFILYFGDEASSADEVIPRRMLDGVIFLGMGRRNGASLENFEKYDMPVVSTGKFVGEKRNIFYVDVDNVQSARLATRHLVANGHTRIAMIKNDDLGLLSSLTRLQGYREALAEKGIEFDERLVIVDDFSFEGGYRAMRRLIDGGQPFTACFAQNDTMAFGAMKALDEARIRIPRDVSLVGFDNVQYAAYSLPALTTIDQSSFSRGRLTANLLLDIVEGKVAGHSVDVPGKLVERDSVKKLARNGATPARRKK